MTFPDEIAADAAERMALPAEVDRVQPFAVHVKEGAEGHALTPFVGKVVLTTMSCAAMLTPSQLCGQFGSAQRLPRLFLEQFEGEGRGKPRSSISSKACSRREWWRRKFPLTRSREQRASRADFCFLFGRRRLWTSQSRSFLDLPVSGRRRHGISRRACSTPRCILRVKSGRSA